MPKGLSPVGCGCRVLLPAALQPQAGLKTLGVPALPWAPRQHAQRRRADWERGCGGVTAMAAPGTRALGLSELRGGRSGPPGASLTSMAPPHPSCLPAFGSWPWGAVGPPTSFSLPLGGASCSVGGAVGSSHHILLFLPFLLTLHTLRAAMSAAAASEGPTGGALRSP